MILYKEKERKKIKEHEWFAWYPVWTWDRKEHNRLYFVWLRKVWRTNGYLKKYRYYLIK